MVINAAGVSTEDLEQYDEMMLTVALSVKNVAPLSIHIWEEVLRELDVRGRVKLHSGSYSDIGNAMIQRLR